MSITFSPRGEEVYHTPELAMIIHEYCDIGVLANLASCNHHNRAQILHILKSKIHAVLMRYMSENEIPLFFTALDDSHGAISASTTLVIFEPSARIEWQPHNLNIVVPWQEPHIIARFLRSIGYIQQGNSRIPFRWYHLVCRHMQFCKSGCPDIFISEGYDKTALPIILGTSTTAVMNAITSTTYYSFYPAMTRRREVVPNWTGAMSGDAQKYSARGYKLFNYAPREGPYMCGQGCALEARRVRGRRGIGVITWTTRHAESYKFDQDEIVWQLGEECRYRHCQNRETVGFSGQR